MKPDARSRGRLQLDPEVLSRHLSSDDAVAVLLRGHLWVEGALTDLIRSDLEVPDEWPDLERLNFPSKVALARAQGALYLGSEPLLALNRVRNQFAHNVTFEMDATTVAQLVAAFPKVSEGDRAEDPNCAPVKPTALASDSEVVVVLREVVLSLLTHLFELSAEVLRDRTAQTERAVQRLNAFLQAEA